MYSLVMNFVRFCYQLCRTVRCVQPRAYVKARVKFKPLVIWEYNRSMLKHHTTSEVMQA